MEELFKEVKSFGEELQNIKVRLPYLLNVIDELRINENAHSRVLFKLLQFKNVNGKYEICQSLLDYIIQNHSMTEFSKINIKNPEIYQGKKYIDLWIIDRDSSYAIIFENKIYNAKDEEEQLSRYIDTTKAEGIEENNIYIIYLSSDGREPSDQTWGKYKESFKLRYVNISFRNDIVPWLKYNILPNIRYKDVYLNHALNQYIDYLEGLFYIRSTEIQMNEELKEYVKKEVLKIKEGYSYEKQQEIIVNKLTNLDKLSDQVLDSETEASLESLKKILYNIKVDTLNAMYEHLKNNLNETFGKDEDLSFEFIDNGRPFPFFLCFKDKDKKWNLSIIFKCSISVDNHTIFYMYIGLPNEQKVGLKPSDDLLMGGHKSDRYPYGYRYIDNYHTKDFSIMVNDSDEKIHKFQDVLRHEVKTIKDNHSKVLNQKYQ